MLDILRKWIDRYLADEEALVLMLLLVVTFTAIVMMGNVLAPVIASAIIAFLLQGMITRLVQWHCPHWLALALTYIVFLGVLTLIIFVVLPLSWRQLITLFNELPRMLNQGTKLLMLLPDQYPDLLTYAQVEDLMDITGAELGKLGQWVVSFSMANIGNLVALVIYLVLVPILVFFFLKDKDQVLALVGNLLPKKRPLMTSIWHEMNDQIANYVRGKSIEIFLVGGVAYVAFVLWDLNYAALLGLLVGLSVVIPYIGATVVTLPVALIAYFQWGLDSHFTYVMVTYIVIQALDGNVLVPLLFSEAVNLHPTAIIMSVLVFGGIWGMWGVFFAIPLATLVKAVFNAWPRAGSNASNATA